MPISSDNRQAGPYVGNDVATAFAFSFKVFAATDLLVILTDASGAENELTLSADYSVALNSNQDSNPGGTVALPAALASGTKLTITSSIAPLQATDLTNQGGFYPKVITNALDKLTILVQQLFNGLSRSIKLPISNGEDGTLPAGDRSSTAVGFDASGKLALIGLQTGTALADMAASTGAALIGFLQSGVGAVKRTILDKIRDRVSVKDFGAVGNWNGTKGSDDTSAFTRAINYVNSTNKTLWVDADVSGNYKISAALPTLLSAGGIEMEAVGYDHTSKGVIEVVGSGFTAVTISGNPARCNLAVVGTGNAANGILFQNPAAARVGKIRAMQLDGFGIKFNKIWDSTIEHAMVELCGNSTEYAFSMNDDGDTCNMTHISSLQVEQSNKQAIYISPNTLSCVIDNIHSERQTADPAFMTWVLGGNRCQYNCARLDALVSANATAKLSGNNTTYTGLLAENAVSVQVEGGNGNPLTIITPEIQGEIKTVTNQTGRISVFGGSINTLNCSAQGFQVHDTKIASLVVGDAVRVPTYALLDNCVIGAISNTSTRAAATLRDCNIIEHGNLLPGGALLIGGSVNSASNATLEVSYRTVTARGTTFNVNITSDNGQFYFCGCAIKGSFGHTSGPVAGFFDDGTYCTGTVSGFGIPTGGSPYSGMYTKNLAPAVGSPKGWSYSTSGAWVSTGNL
ncbi:hypothetical protein [Niveibacterium terrae]|uniref:hypothetical protein n=1 Tax=Niveibacterium terrae TaxID=3373598 RepID=UPI003A92E82F